MTITPTDKGALIAGGVFWTLVWTIMLKINHIPYLGRVVKTDRILAWIRGHVALTLVCTEVINMSMHPPSNPASAMFAFGGTIVNSLAVLIVWLTGLSKHEKRFV
jgi:hypothetical protein